MRRHVTALCCAGMLAVGCSTAAPPRVSFTVGAATVTAAPTQNCDAEVTDCTADASAVVTLAVPPGSPVAVSVPEEVASAPWHLVFSYRNAAGEVVDGRSPLIRPGQRRDYTLVLPVATDRLERAEVQQFGTRHSAGPGGDTNFAIRASWVLLASPA